MPLCDLNLEEFIKSRFEPMHQLPPPVERHMSPYRSEEWKLTGTQRIMKEITLGLEFVHGQGLTHRDLKPRNGKEFALFDLTSVLFSPNVDTWQLADFGLAAQGSSKAVHTTRYARGTDCYRSPELIKDSSFNNKVDIWSLGCILHELLLGK